MGVLIAWYEDCILFSYHNENFFNTINTLSPHYFEDITIEEEAEGITSIQYRWIDPIRVKDKIYAKEQKEVTFWIYKKEKLICCFGNSESGISYAINKIAEKTSTQVTKVNTFSIWKKEYYDKDSLDNWIGDLTTIHVKTNPTPFNNTEIKKIKVNDLAKEEIDQLLSKFELTNMNFIFQSTPFYLDTNSVISFLNTVSEEEINVVIGKIIREISNKLWKSVV